jgi:hypothetical protein
MILFGLTARGKRGILALLAEMLPEYKRSGFRRKKSIPRFSGEG